MLITSGLASLLIALARRQLIIERAPQAGTTDLRYRRVYVDGASNVFGRFCSIDGLRMLRSISLARRKSESLGDAIYIPPGWR